MSAIPGIPRLTGIAILAWVSMLGVDFFLHAGVLAGVYIEPSGFLLPKEEAFRLVPLGYFSFLLLDVLLVWLMVRLNIVTAKGGLSFGLIVGVLVWGAMTTGLLSISTASPKMMLGWFVGQTVELGVAGAVIGAGLSGTPIGKITARVIALVIALAVVTVVAQNVGQASIHR